MSSDHSWFRTLPFVVLRLSDAGKTRKKKNFRKKNNIFA